ncbi:MAG: lipocalin family protein, partial [Bacteroidetes bacterium]|nr:lipocalin family protein [Bacteroidota bacterium]
PLETVKEVDLSKYVGKWYEIASFPQSFQKGCSCTSAEYIITDKKYIKVLNSCDRNGTRTSATGKAFVQKNTGNAKLKVQFFWPFSGKYWIIDLADDYSYAVVGHPNLKYLWILSRTKQMDENIYNSICEKLKAKEFDITKLEVTNHSCK